MTRDQSPDSFEMLRAELLALRGAAAQRSLDSEPPLNKAAESQRWLGANLPALGSWPAHLNRYQPPSAFREALAEALRFSKKTVRLGRKHPVFCDIRKDCDDIRSKTRDERSAARKAWLDEWFGFIVLVAFVIVVFGLILVVLANR
jgi:hypothetical protein